MKKGYVTVFFSIVISICLSLLVGLVYGARENACRLKANEAIDISLNSAFAEYQRDIWRRYKLLYVDAGYGFETDSMIMPEEHLTDFVNRNFDEGIPQILGGKDLLSMNCSGADTEAVRFATDFDGQGVRNQAIRVMEYKYGIQYVMNLYSYVTEAEDRGLFGEVLKELADRATSEADTSKAPLMSDWVNEVQGGIYEEKDPELFSSLRIIFGDISNISKTSLIDDVLIENRDINVGNYSKGTDSDMPGNLLFKEYLLSYCGNYIEEKKDTVLKYETEYLIKGRNADAENLESVVNRILLIREAANVSTLLSDTERMESIKTFSEAALTILLVPEFSPVLEALIVATWSYMESISDVRVLINGGKVPLIKSADEWRTGMLDIFSKGSGVDSYEKGISYKDYLRILIYFADTDSLTKRFMNVIEANVRKDTDNDKFRLDNCFDAWSVSIYVNSKFGHFYLAEREKDMED